MPINPHDMEILKFTVIICKYYLENKTDYLNLAFKTALYCGSYLYVERHLDKERHYDLKSIDSTDRKEYNRQSFMHNESTDYDYNEWEKQEITWFDITRLTESDYAEIKERTEKLLAFTISLLDKYSGNQDGDLNLRFITMQYQTLEIINSLETSKQEVYFKHFLNPNIFDSTGLLGILPGNERLEYLEYYKQANWIELVEFIEKLYDKYQARIEVLIPINIDNLPIKSDGNRGIDKVCRLDPTDPAYDYPPGLKQYLIIFDLLVIRLKHNYEPKTSNSKETKEINSFTLSNLVLILSSKTLIEALNLTTSQLSQLEGFLLNLEFDGEQLDNRIIFDNERWQFIYHWIDQMRTWLVKNG